MERHSIKDFPELTRKKNKYGVNPDKSKRTYKGVLYASVWEMKRAVFLDQNEIEWTRQTPFWFGDGAWKYIPDFQIFGLPLAEDGFLYSSHFEDVKGAARKRLPEIRRMWKAYGPLPLWIIRLEKDQWIIEEIIQP